VQLRLPALLAAHALLVGAAFARAHVFPDQALTPVVVGRLAACLVGVALDLRRRALFMTQQHQLQAQQGRTQQQQQSGVGDVKGPGSQLPTDLATGSTSRQGSGGMRQRGSKGANW
jgi:hypothetical protein